MATRIDPDLLSILCCPETHQPLEEASEDLVARLNQGIRSGRLVNRAGQTVGEPIEGGLVRADRQVLYPIRGNIPILLIDEALPIPRVPKSRTTPP